MQNKAQYDLDRKVAKLSSWSSNGLDKYEYLIREDLVLERIAVEQAKIEYSPLCKIFNKGLDEDNDKREELLKRLKHIETNQKSNSNDKSELSGAKSESNEKTSSSDNDDEALNSFEYLKDNAI